jgi:hydroxyacylglutathione hydrolase
MKVTLIPAFEDNYFFSVAENSSVMVVDPGGADEVLASLQARGERLEWIVVTHYHNDHIGGVAELQARTGAKLIGPASLKTKGLNCDIVAEEAAEFKFHSFSFQILKVPGHTLDHVAYYCSASQVLFCGDTLFSLGCGRLFEGTFEAMFNSLDGLRSLPNDTKVYCAHEYTLKNMMFSIDYLKKTGAAAPILSEYQKEFERLQGLRARNEPTVPSTLAFEKRFNLFLKAATLHEFKSVREARNIF